MDGPIDERGVTLWETLIVVVMLMGMWVGMRGGFYGTHRPAQQASAMFAMQSLLDQARAVAAVDGSTLTVTSAASGPSTVQIYDGYLAGNVVLTGTLDTPLALFDGTTTYDTFTFAIKRDGSFVPYAGGVPASSSPLACGALAVGADLDGTLAQAQPLDCSDARLRALPPTPSAT